jgi:membrane protease YdiL (CAAX protease family)
MCEETIFRVILFQRLLLTGLSFWPAALLSSAAFGAIHFGQGQEVVLASTCHGTFYAYIHYCFCGVSPSLSAVAVAAGAVIGLHSLNNSAIILPHAPGWEQQKEWLYRYAL